MELPSLRPKFLTIVAGLAPLLAISAPPSATAEIFFRPFGYAFHRPIAEPEPDVSPRRIAAILARRGFRLFGPLGYRGDQIVAAGVDARGVRMRFLVDPYEGEILSSWRIAPTVAHHAPTGPALESYGAPEAVPAENGEPRVIPGIGGETLRPSRPRAATPTRARTAAHPSGEAASRAARHLASPAAPAPAAAVSPPAAAAPPAAPSSDGSAPAAAAPTPATTTAAPAQPQTVAVPVDAEAAPAPSTPPASQPEEPAPGAANGAPPQSTSGG